MLDENNIEIIRKQSYENSERATHETIATKVLYLDDDRVMLENFKTIYSPYFDVFTTDCAEIARETIKTQEINIIISDQRMPKITGVQFFTSIVKDYPNTIRILLTAFTEVDVVINAINQGQIYQYVRKPYIFHDMKKMLEDASQIYHIRKNRNSTQTKESEW
jgi:DNA-binding NtrC family response regulator